MASQWIMQRIASRLSSSSFTTTSLDEFSQVTARLCSNRCISIVHGCNLQGTQRSRGQGCNLFVPTRPLRSRDDFEKRAKAGQTAKAAAASQSKAAPKGRSGVVYADNSGAGGNPKAKVYGSAKEFHQDLHGDSPSIEATRKHAKDAENWIVTLNKVRKHPVYAVTRIGALGFAFIMMGRRVRNAVSLPEEEHDENTPLLIKAERVFWKTVRIVILTLKRAWNPLATYRDASVATESPTGEVTLGASAPTLDQLDAVPPASNASLAMTASSTGLTPDSVIFSGASAPQLHEISSPGEGLGRNQRDSV